MLKFIDEILLCFRPCFSRMAAFEWFATIITGLMVRSDSLGITSIIRGLVLDRYFLTVPLLKEWKACSEKAPGLLHVVTRAKRNCTAYERPGAYKGRGRRPVHGTAVHLRDLFISDAALFQEAQLRMYGTEKKVRFLSGTYLWGQKLYQPLKFVLVEYENTQSNRRLCPVQRHCHGDHPDAVPEI